MYPRVVRAARAMLGMSQEELARVCLISWTTLNSFERERTKLSDRTRRAIIRTLEERGIIFRIEDENAVGIHVAAGQSDAR